jgi:hypothetical protein
MSDNPPQKPDLLDWLGNVLNLPFRIPRIPFAQTAKNVDKAASMLVLASAENIAAPSTHQQRALRLDRKRKAKLIDFGADQIKGADVSESSA